MRTYSTALNNYRTAGKAFWPVHFISFRVKDKVTPASLTWCHFCTGEDNLTVSVTDPDTGGLVSRTFAGSGHIIQMGDVVRSEGAVIRSHSFTLSGASTLVQDMMYGYNCREALFQWFIGELDQDSGLLIDEPQCEFVGFVNTMEPKESPLSVDSTDNAESYVTVSVDSLSAALTDRNYDMRSVDVSEVRGGDKIFSFAGAAHHWNIRWGKEKKREKNRKDDGGDGGKRKGANR